MGYTLMAARADPRPIRVFTLRPIREPPERWKLAHVAPSEPAYNGIYPDGRLSRSTAYTGLHPDGDPSGSLLKDGGSPASIPRSQPNSGSHPSRSTVYTGLHPDGDPSGSLLKDGGSPTSISQSQPIMGYTLMAAEQIHGLYGSSP